MLLKHHVRTHRATNGICVKQGERLLEMGHVSIEQRLGEDEGHRALAGQILSQPKQLSQLAAASRLEKYLGPRNISILEITFQFLLMVRKFPPPAPPRLLYPKQVSSNTGYPDFGYARSAGLAHKSQGGEPRGPPAGPGHHTPRGGSRETQAGPMGRATRLGPRRGVKAATRRGPRVPPPIITCRQRVSWLAS